MHEQPYFMENEDMIIQSYYDGIPPEIEEMSLEELEIEIEKEKKRLAEINSKKNTKRK